MLTRLQIHNIALIEAVELEFYAGLNVLTGETGAGKSILIDAMNLGLGARSDKELIKSGCSEARVEMAFDIAGNDAVNAMLEEMETVGDDGTLILSRTLTAAGRNSCRVNGRMVTVAQLKRLTTLLIDIHGQHEHQSLMNEARHMDMLDGFGGEAVLSQRAMVAKTYDRYHQLQTQMLALYGSEQERARRADILRYQVNEILSARLIAGEDEDLAEQLKRMQHAEEISGAVRTAYEALYGAADAPAALDGANAAAHELGRIAPYGAEYQSLRERLDTVVVEMEDIARDLRRRAEAEEFDEGALNDIQNRMDAIRQLKRKYGGSVADVLRTGEEMAAELHALENADEELARMNDEIGHLEVRLREQSEKLTGLRSTAGQRFAKLVEAQLADLGMAHARFDVEFEPREGSVEELASARGFDRLRFVISPNPGESMKPLARIASGGEMSRIMLALKNIAARADSIPTLIFDEIDTGISGTMARVVAQKLAQISADHQVICVTHTAQIAAMGASHFFIEKQTDGKRTQTSVTLLDEGRRVGELARLVGGEVSTLSGEHAAQMLQWSLNYRQKIVR